MYVNLGVAVSLRLAQKVVAKTSCVIKYRECIVHVHLSRKS